MKDLPETPLPISAITNRGNFSSVFSSIALEAIWSTFFWPSYDLTSYFIRAGLTFSSVKWGCVTVSWCSWYSASKAALSSNVAFAVDGSAAMEALTASAAILSSIGRH